MMERLDPELVAPLEGFLGALGGGLDLENIAATRAMLDSIVAAINAEAPAIEGVETEDRQVPGPAGAPDVPVRIYRPANRSEPLPALLWMHPGGWVLGSLEMEHLMAAQLAKDAQAVIVSVNYRLAPEHPFPAAPEDCYAALKWVAAQADELGVERTRIAVGGSSAGGALAAALALMARDRGDVDLCLQFLLYPPLDDRHVAPAATQEPDTLFWTRGNSLVSWQAYLGDRFGADDVPAYAAVARAKDLRGLAPAHLAVGSLDLFAKDNLEYARRLIEAEVPTELHVYPGVCHAFDAFAPQSRVAQRFAGERIAVLKRALHG